MQKEELCVHCGAGCGNNPVVSDKKNFCCYGCKTVYEILSANKLTKYYEIQPMSGIRMDNPPQIKAFAFLDIPEIRDKMLTFNDGERSSVKFFIPGIHCASCIWLLENLNTLHPGVINSAVNFPRKEVFITFNNSLISLRQLAELLTSIHYQPEITLDSISDKKSASPDRKLLVKIGIAGFSFLNIMLYSFPEYVPGGELLEQEFRQVFGWMSFFLALPVVFYSASDYYISAYKGLKHGIISIDLPITLGIIALFLQSSFEVFSGNGIGYMDSLAGLLFFLLIGKWYQGKTYQALSFERDYKSYFPVAVTRLDDGKEEIIPVKYLKPGDRILIRNNELIPADSVIVKGSGSIDYSFVTGEAVPQPRKCGDFVYAGGRQSGSSIELTVEHEVEQSYLTRLWNTAGNKPEAGMLNNTINKVSRYFTLIVLIIAFASFTVWAFADSLSTAVYVFASVLIIACPCALALTTPFTFGSIMRVFGRKGFYIRKTDVVEQLFSVDTVVFDKTGTITLNRKVSVSCHGKEFNDDEKRLIRSLVRHSSHPLSAALYSYLPESQAMEPEYFEEIPGMGINAVIEGRRVNIGSRVFVTGQTEGETLAESRVYVAFDGVLQAYFTLSNQYREGLEEVIAELCKNYKLHLISGDNDAERDKLRTIFGERAQLSFNCSPTDKKEYIRQLKEQGKKVLMIGDGLNDAGALTESHAGISVADDVFSFSPASDAILESSQFGQLGGFIRFTTQGMKIVRASFLVSFVYNIIGLSFAVSAMLSPLIAAILMPLSSITIVVLTTLSVEISAGRFFKN